jgi:hypothetical protein
MSKSTADDTKKISTSFLKKHNYFCGWNSGTMTWTRSGMWGEHKSSVGIEVSTMHDDKYLRIHYTQTDRDTDEKKDFDYKIPLTTTPCRYGGVRYWFTCPWYKNGVYCGRRVSKSTKTEITLLVAIATTLLTRAETEVDCIGVSCQSQMLKKRGKP